MKENVTDEAEFESYLVCQKWRKEMASRGLEREGFIKGHIAKVGDYPSASATRHKNLTEKRELYALEQRRRKQADDEFDHKMKYFKLYRWALIRAHREDKEEQARVRLSIKHRCRKLLTLGAAYLLFQKVYATFDA